MNRVQWAVVCASLVGVAGAAPAATVGGSSTGVFTGSPVAGLTGFGTSSITFGTGAYGSGPSQIGFAGLPVSGNSGDVVAVGRIDFCNGVIWADSIHPNPFAFALQLSLGLTDPTSTSQTLTIPLRQFASLNVAGPLANADVLEILGLPTATFSAGGWDYTVELLGFGPATGDGFGTATRLTAYEWGDTRFPADGTGFVSAPLLGRVTAVRSLTVADTTPEPGTLAVLGLLAAGGVAYSRRRRGMA